MKILSRNPGCENLELEKRSYDGKPRKQPKMTYKRCEGFLEDIRLKIDETIHEIKSSNDRQIAEKVIQGGVPEEIDITPEELAVEMGVTKGRIALERNELMLLSEQLEATWTKVPEKLKPLFQDAINAMRKDIEKQLNPKVVAKSRASKTEL